MTMTNELQVFEFKGHDVRTIMRDGYPWWVAKDVCDVLELGNITEALRNLDEDERCSELVNTPGGKQKMSIVSEPGLYSSILRSRKPEAKEFKRWITHEVLPSVRKHGAYMTPETLEKTLTNPDFIIKLATELKQEQEKRKALETQAAIDRPKTIFADAVAESKTSILIGDLAKLIKQNGFDIGQKRLFEWLRSKGWLIKSGSSKNIPTQRAMEQGLFEVKERTINAPDGHIIISKTTKVTGKGQVYFINKFLGDTTLPLVEPPLKLEA